jgi:hypothetical protein
MAEHIECPECGKKAVVRCKDNLYQCLSCNFKRDFSEPPQAQSDKSLLWVTVAAGMAALLLLQARSTTFKPQMIEGQSPQAPIAIQPQTN